MGTVEGTHAVEYLKKAHLMAFEEFCVMRKLEGAHAVVKFEAIHVMVELNGPHVKEELEAGCAMMVLKESDLVIEFQDHCVVTRTEAAAIQKDVLRLSQNPYP